MRGINGLGGKKRQNTMKPKTRGNRGKEKRKHEREKTER